MKTSQFTVPELIGVTLSIIENANIMENWNIGDLLHTCMCIQLHVSEFFHEIPGLYD
jgi:hypothetical protein